MGDLGLHVRIGRKGSTDLGIDVLSVVAFLIHLLKNDLFDGFHEVLRFWQKRQPMRGARQLFFYN